MKTLSTSLLLLGLGAASAGAQSVDPGAAPDGWRINGTAYVWFQGVHGDASALGQQINIDAGPSQLMSDADFDLQVLVNARYRRFVMVGDISWTPFTVNKSSGSILPLPPGVSMEMKYKPLIATPEIGYRLIEHRALTVDGLVGARYWYFKGTLTLTPSPDGKSHSKTSDWVDPLVGARVQYQLSPRFAARLAGDIGGFGAGARADHQIVAALGYQFARRWAVDAAWRSLYVNYQESQLGARTTMSGAVVGITYGLR